MLKNIIGSQKILAIIIASVVVITTVLVAVFIFTSQSNKTSITIGSGAFSAKIAYNEASRTKGLKGTSSLEENQAMLFVFPTEDRWTMSSKDMEYPIDIVWINQNFEVIYMIKDASKTSATTEFTPTLRAKYVVELPSGSIDKHAISTGVSAIFSIDEGSVK